MIEHGGAIVQETRLFDAAQGKTYSMRSKEEAHDYRYFPDPDLPALVVDAARRERDRRARCPSCPTRGAAASSTQYALPEYDAALLTQTRGVADYFEETAQRVRQSEGGQQLGDGRGAAQHEGARHRHRRRCRSRRRRWPG